jgi:hypothetical protein
MQFSQSKTDCAMRKTGERSNSLTKFRREERKTKQRTRELALAQEAIIESLDDETIDLLYKCCITSARWRFGTAFC